jgi:CheY-like chemotaxis protein
MNSCHHIAIINHNSHDAHCLAELLRQNSSVESIVIEPDGQDAVDHWKSNHAAGGFLPGLIFTTLQLPRLDGFAVLEWLRSHHRFASVPVIVLTETHNTAEIERAYALGANFCMVKPADLRRFQQMIHATCAFWGLCIVPETPAPAEQSRTPFRTSLHEDWTESAWFTEWLLLARKQHAALP